MTQPKTMTFCSESLDALLTCFDRFIFIFDLDNKMEYYFIPDQQMELKSSQATPPVER